MPTMLRHTLGLIGIATSLAANQRIPAYLDNTDFPGHDIRSVHADTKEDCAKACAETPGCKAASWNGPTSHYHDGGCNMKDAGDYPTNDGKETGIVLVPEDWYPAWSQADLLYSDKPNDVRYKPEIGNGYFATVVGSDTIFAAGLFNGCLGSCSKQPSHRARIPAPLALNVGRSITAAALDVRHGMYMRNYDDGVRLSFYAHRQFKSLLVVEASTDQDVAGEVQLHGAGGADVSSDDFVWQSSTRQAHSGATLRVWSGVIKEVEQASEAKSRVVVVFPDSISTVSVSKKTPVKLVAAIRTSLDSDDPEQAAVDDWELAEALSTADLRSSHEAAWADLWKSGLEIKGRFDVGRAVNTSMYYILSSVRADTFHSLSPGGLASNGYNGHTFWDCETFMYPMTVLWYPEIAASLLQYRINTVPGAEQKAKSYNKGYKGAMFAWESAATGVEECPSWADTGTFEQHITGDIALAAQQLWYAHANTSWLATAYPDLLSKTADFWVSRVSQTSDGVAHIRHVIPPDEYVAESASHTCDDSVYTNYVAQRNLIFAAEAANVLGKTPDVRWSKIAAAIPILFDATHNVHPEYEGYGHSKIKQADVVLLGFPFMMNMSADVRRADLEWYAAVTDTKGPAMTWAMHAVGYMELNDTASAASNFNRGFANVQAPFGVWSETPTGGAVNFITGAGGFLQSAQMGLTGLRIWPDHLALNPVLIEGMEEVYIRNVQYRRAAIDIRFDSTVVTIGTSVTSPQILVTNVKTGVSVKVYGAPKKMSLGSYTITVPAPDVVLQI